MKGMCVSFLKLAYTDRTSCSQPQHNSNMGRKYAEANPPGWAGPSPRPLYSSLMNSTAKPSWAVSFSLSPDWV